MFVTTDPARDTEHGAARLPRPLRPRLRRAHRRPRRRSSTVGKSLGIAVEQGAQAAQRRLRRHPRHARCSASTATTRSRSCGPRAPPPPSSPPTSTSCSPRRTCRLTSRTCSRTLPALLPAVHPQPVRRASGTSARCRSAATRCASSSASSPRSGSASGAGWPAAAGPARSSDIAVWAVPFGLVGGRLYHVITDYDLYFGERRHPVEALYIWHGGLGIWGAIALGALGVLIGCRRRGIKCAADGRRAGAGRAGRPGASAAGATGSTRSSSASPPTCRGGWRSTSATGRRATSDFATFHPTFLYESSGTSPPSPC